jgi:hypothetical protein
MKHAVALVLLVPGCLLATDKTVLPALLDSPPPMSAAEQKVFEENERKERAAAIARLSKFDDQRLEQVLDALRGIKFPVSFSELEAKLGGPNSMVWCFTRKKLGMQKIKTRSMFALSDSKSGIGDYELVVDYVDSPLGTQPHMVARARLCYFSPLGWSFEAVSMEDMVNIGSAEEEPNQPPLRMPVSGTPAADAPVAPLPGIAGR